MQLDGFIWFSIYASILSVIAPIICYSVYIKISYPRHLHFIGVLCWASGVTDLIVFILAHYRKLSVIPTVHNILFIIQFCLLTAYFYETALGKKTRSYVWIIILHSIVAGGLTYYFGGGLFTYQGIGYTLGNGIFLLYSIYYVKKIFWLPESERANIVGTSWITVGILIYFSVGVWIFIMRDRTIVTISNETEKFLWIFHNIFNIIKNLLIAKGFYEAAKRIVKNPY